MAKKRLLFVIDSLNVGGAEKSLVTLLNLLDYSRYEVDLQLFAYGGAFQQFLPPNIKVLPPLDYTEFLTFPLWKQLQYPKFLYARLMYSVKIRKEGLLHADKACLYWQTIGSCVKKGGIDYDVAIAYAQGIPTFYTIDKIKAKKKLVWVNVDYKLHGATRAYQRSYYEKADVIVPVSDSAFNVFATLVYPEFREKMKIMWDINDGQMIQRMSELPSDKPIKKDVPVIMTAGRLNKPQKGYDLALEAAKILRDRGVQFRWYAIGDGPYRGEMERFIAENQLQEHFILLGFTANPYSYMRQCDVYVQTSRHEGFGLTIAEARILNRPVVCTNFEACTMQMVDGKNGLITSFEPQDIANAIEKLLNDDQLYGAIQTYLAQEKKGNVDEIKRFYELIEN